MYRFFVETKNGAYFPLDINVLRHLKAVRLGASEHFICIYQHVFYECTLEQNRARIVKTLSASHEFSAPVALGLALIDEKHWEWALQKATELGVTHLYPLVTARTNKALVQRYLPRVLRYQSILRSAAEQSFRNAVPLLMPLTPLHDALNLNYASIILAHEQTSSPVPSAFRPDVLLLVGPEGGFDEAEVAAAAARGVTIISLGLRILRAETAALTLLAKVLPN